MDTIIYLSDYRLCFESLKKYRNYKKVLIIEKNFRNNGEISKEYFDLIYTVENAFDVKEYEKIIENISRENKITAIIVPDEDFISLGGYLRSTFGINGMQREQAISVTNKSIMKSIIRRNGIKTSKTVLVHARKDIYNFLNDVGFPIVVKPVTGSATVNTLKLSCEDDLEKYLQFIKIDQPILIEEFVEGREFHCDSIVLDGKVVFSSVGEYLYTCLDTVQNKKPLGSIIHIKKDDSLDYIRNIKLMNRDVIQALKITNSVCHAEMFVKPNGEVYFGEIGARVGGGYVIPPCIKNTFNIDLLDALVGIEMGNYKIQDIKESGYYTGMICFRSLKGTVKKISHEEDFTDIKGLINIKILFNEGQDTKDTNKTSIRAGFGIIQGKNHTDLRKKLLNLYDRFILEV